MISYESITKYGFFVLELWMNLFTLMELGSSLCKIKSFSSGKKLQETQEISVAKETEYISQKNCYCTISLSIARACG